jgi:threonine aldolase
MRIVDLRSDTVTLPTPEMMKAIMNARLGDDQYGEDPTVSELQAKAAAKLGKEDALLVVSGTQGNLVSIMSQTYPGDKIVLEAESHIYYYEAGGLSAIAGVIPHLVRGRLGVPDLADVEKAAQIQHRYHQPRPTLLCLENTHCRAGGTCITPKQTRELALTAKSYNMRVHIDGARIFNAAVALGTDVRNLTRDVDSVTFCLSKGLSCPVGSIVAGDKEFIEKARRCRQMLGGAMRQAGIIAAPGLVALETMIDRLREDHENAKRLAEGLVKMGVSIEMERVQTNMVFIDVSQFGISSAEFISRIARYGIKASNYGPTTVRMVTHRGIEKEDIDYALEAINSAIGHMIKNV